jgi:hypothetical protein
MGEFDVAAAKPADARRRPVLRRVIFIPGEVIRATTMQQPASNRSARSCLPEMCVDACAGGPPQGLNISDGEVP